MLWIVRMSKLTVITTPDKTPRKKSHRLKPSEINPARIRGLVRDIKGRLFTDLVDEADILLYEEYRKIVTG